MANKLTLQDVANLQNESSVVTTLAENNRAIEAAVEKTLSRDGQAPNAMQADFDMNSHKILNLPDALTDQEPATFSQLKDYFDSVNSGAVQQASYITVDPNVILENERVLLGSANISISDGGPNTNITIAVSDNELNALATTTAASDTVPYFTGASTASTTPLTSYARSLIDDVDAVTARSTLDAQQHDVDLDAVAGLSTTGLISRTGAGTASTRTLAQPSAGIIITNGDGVAGNPTLALANDLNAVEGLSTNGLAARTATDTWTTRTLTAPAAGITVTNGNGVSGNPTLALADDLNALENLATTGIVRRTGTSTWTASNAVTNSELNTMGAYTFKGNNTGSSATPTDVDIATLTTKASPAASDYVMISDQAASGAWKKAQVSALAAASGVSSIAGNSGVFTLSHGITNATNDIQLDMSLQQGALFGLTLSTAGSSTTFSVASGFAVDTAATDFMKLSSSISKTTSSWAVGSTNGGLDTGSIAANTWYHVYLIKRPDTGVVDVLVSLSASSPTMPTNYTLKRRIGSMKTNGSSQWTLFKQLGDEFLWDTPSTDVNVNNLGTTATLFTVSVPTGLKVNALIRGYVFHNTTPGTIVLVNSPDEASVAANSPVGDLTAIGPSNVSAGSINTNVRTDTSAQVRAVSQNASTFLTLVAYGWIDTRGRLY